MKATTHETLQQVASRTIAPEDIAIGDYIAITRSLIETPSFLWRCDESIGKREVLVPMWMMPSSTQPPLKVRRICLPFVLATTVERRVQLLDMRMVQVARVDPQFGRSVRRRFRKDKNKPLCG